MKDYIDIIDENNNNVKAEIIIQAKANGKNYIVYKINSEIYASKYLEDKNDEYLDLDNNLSEDEYEMVELYYNIGQAINELIDEYNLEKSQNEIIKSFSNKLTKQFGQGFSVPSLKKMKKFYQVFNGGSTL